MPKELTIIDIRVKRASLYRACPFSTFEVPSLLGTVQLSLPSPPYLLRYYDSIVQTAGRDVTRLSVSPLSNIL